MCVHSMAEHVNICTYMSAVVVSRPSLVMSDERGADTE